MSCPLGYPNIENFNLESFNEGEFLDSVSSTWCPPRCAALGKMKGHRYLQRWGFAYLWKDIYDQYVAQDSAYEACDNPSNSEVKFPYDCGLFDDPLGIWGTSGKFRTYAGSVITIAQTRDLIDCEEISGALSYASTRRGHYATEAGNSTGTARRKNLCNEAAWKYIEDFFNAADSASQNFISCYNVLQQQILEGGEDDLEAILDSMPEPMNNVTLAAIIGGTGLGMILILNKVVK